VSGDNTALSRQVLPSWPDPPPAPPSIRIVFGSHRLRYRYKLFVRTTAADEVCTFSRSKRASRCTNIATGAAGVAKLGQIVSRRPGPENLASGDQRKDSRPIAQTTRPTPHQSASHGGMADPGARRGRLTVRYPRRAIGRWRRRNVRRCQPRRVRAPAAQEPRSTDGKLRPGCW
jgi:hypothetical protein